MKVFFYVLFLAIAAWAIPETLREIREDQEEQEVKDE